MKLSGLGTPHCQQRLKGNVRKAGKRGMGRNRVCKVAASQDDVPVDQLLAAAQEAANTGAAVSGIW